MLFKGSGSLRGGGARRPSIFLTATATGGDAEDATEGSSSGASKKVLGKKAMSKKKVDATTTEEDKPDTPAAASDSEGGGSLAWRGSKRMTTRAVRRVSSLVDGFRKTPPSRAGESDAG